MLIITDNDIRYAERILLSKELEFDQQRKDFIRNLETIDLQAVPGSGKTTSLLAKLLILENRLPFNDGSGILVISHTNTAVDEIKERIGGFCPKLFSYPNFVGTIQSFVDHFLATPLFVNTYRRKPYRIDDEIYEEKVYRPGRAQGWLSNNPNIGEKVLFGSRLNSVDDLVWGFNYSGTFPLKAKTSDTYRAICEMKKKLRSNGVLCFDDAYFLAMKAVAEYPILKRLLRSRFRYVFVDEMQDMDKHQYDLLEELFYDGGKADVIFQRIGDKNQAIFSGAMRLEDFWNSDGREVLNVDGSCRFSDEIASVVKWFALEPKPVLGRSPNKSVKPHLLVYRSETILNVLPTFVDLIKEKLATNGTVNLIGNVKAIGWRKSAEDGKVAINDYFPQFNDDTHINKIDYSTLRGYLHNVKVGEFQENSLAEGRKNILNAFLRILRYENITDQDGRYYSKRRLMSFLGAEKPSLYEEFKLNLYIWSKGIYEENTSDVIKSIKEVVPIFLKNVFGASELSNETEQLIGGDLNKSIESERNGADALIEPQNLYEKDGYAVEVGTIHSIKGETHVATLYMETYYDKGYESERLKKCFLGKPHGFSSDTSKDIRKKESIKMAYVGMSRPTHLLCVAVHEERAADYLDDIPDDNWEKIMVTE